MGLPVHREALFDHPVRLAHAALGVSVHSLLVGDQIGGQSLIHPRAGRVQRLPHRGDGGQHLVIHLHLFASVLGQIPVGGDDAGDRIALKAHLVARQGVHFHRLQAVDGRRHALAGGPLRQVLASEHRDHARQLPRSRGIDPQDAGVRMGRSHEAGMERPGHLEVIDIVAPTGEQAKVFLARQVLADVAELRARHTPRFPASAAPLSGWP